MKSSLPEHHVVSSLDIIRFLAAGCLFGLTVGLLAEPIIQTLRAFIQ